MNALIKTAALCAALITSPMVAQSQISDNTARISLGHFEVFFATDTTEMREIFLSLSRVFFAAYQSGEMTEPENFSEIFILASEGISRSELPADDLLDFFPKGMTQAFQELSTFDGPCFTFTAPFGRDGRDALIMMVDTETANEPDYLTCLTLAFKAPWDITAGKTVTPATGVRDLFMAVQEPQSQ